MHNKPGKPYFRSLLQLLPRAPKGPTLYCASTLEPLLLCAATPRTSPAKRSGSTRCGKCPALGKTTTLQSGTFALSQLVADNSRQERKILQQFLARLNRYPGTIYTFSGTSFDERVLKNRMDKYRMDFSSLPEFTDVYHGIRSSIVFPLKSYSLKSISKFFGYEYRHPDLDGFSVAIEYLSNYQRTKDKKLLRRLLEYNEDDIRSLPWMLDRIASMVGTLEVATERITTETLRMEFNATEN